MSANSFGHLFKITTFGESHGPAMGVVIEGCPSGVSFKEEILNDFLQRRRPGQSLIVTARNEPDKFEILSGIFEGVTLGTPITILVYNKDQNSKSYDEIKVQARVGHADDVWRNKFVKTDHRGGGRSSGRETISRVIGGAFAKMFLESQNSQIQVNASISHLGSLINNTDQKFPEGMEDLLLDAKKNGESYGGHILVNIKDIQQNLGQPVFKKLKSELAGAFMSVGAVVGVELKDSFVNVLKKGTEFHNSTEDIYRGIRGGISTGEDIQFKIAMKPTSSILDTAKKGRHDPCILIRALPVIESMAYLVMADQLLWQRLDNT